MGSRTWLATIVLLRGTSELTGDEFWEISYYITSELMSGCMAKILMYDVYPNKITSSHSCYFLLAHD